MARPWITPLLVRALSGTELAVREKYWGNPFRLSYTPLAHGLVVLDPLARELRLEARLNASTVAFAVLAWKAVASFGDLGTNLFLIGLVAGLVALQVWRYGEVLTATARAAERTS